jgi:hypothetical protein
MAGQKPKRPSRKLPRLVLQALEEMKPCVSPRLFATVRRNVGILNETLDRPGDERRDLMAAAALLGRDPRNLDGTYNKRVRSLLEEIHDAEPMQSADNDVKQLMVSAQTAVNEEMLREIRGRARETPAPQLWRMREKFRCIALDYNRVNYADIGADALQLRFLKSARAAVERIENVLIRRREMPRRKADALLPN